MAKTLRERRARAANRNQKRTESYQRAQLKALLKSDSIENIAVLLAFGTRVRVRAGNGEWSNHCGRVLEFWKTDYGTTVRVRFEKAGATHGNGQVGRSQSHYIVRFDACQIEPFERAVQQKLTQSADIFPLFGTIGSTPNPKFDREIMGDK